MEPMQQSEETIAAETQDLKVDVNVDKPGAIVKPPAPSPSTEQPWQEWVQIASEFLSKLPDYVGDFFSSYQKPLLTVGLILTAGISVKVTLAVLDAINDIPLLAPVFELVGIGYSVWFVNRYLLKVETRKELGNEFNALKGQVVGKDEA
ncbi:CAAD domain-containing protein [Allocoleopsis sp.]|uniref:CAAD domain-containing protein n=1 Tax=Allocoleopsis sp. TaxID=3088169 RepID=UPI0039C85692